MTAPPPRRTINRLGSANKDFSQFLRTEQYKGKTQHVMMDAEGPGAVVRIWVTWVHRPENMVRVFLDGSDEPVIEAPLYRFIDGGELAGPPLDELSRLRRSRRS